MATKVKRQERTRLSQKHHLGEKVLYGEFTNSVNAYGYNICKNKGDVFLVEGCPYDRNPDDSFIKALFCEHVLSDPNSKTNVEKSTEREASPFSLRSTSDLLTIIRSSERETIQRARALEVLLERREPEKVGDLIGEELLIDNLSISWRNTLLLSLEHVSILDRDLRKKVFCHLFSVAPKINNEMHPRSRHALHALVRTLPTIIDDSSDISRLLLFLGLDFSIEIKRIVLLGIQNIFNNHDNLREENIRETIINRVEPLAKYLLCQSDLEQNENETDLGLDALETLMSCACENLPELIVKTKEIQKTWILRSLRKSLEKQSKIWDRFPSEIKPCEEYVAELSSALNFG